MNQETFDIVKNFTDVELNAYFLGWAVAHGLSPTEEDRALALQYSKEAIAERIATELTRV